jgi:hypothetical protein
VDLFHGTRCNSIASITNTGLRTSPDGRLGPGIYFAEEYAARCVAAHRSQGTGIAVFKVRVNISKCKTGMHPPWAGIPNHFQEWCLIEGKNYEISAVVMADGVIDGNVNAPGVDFHFSGNCTIAGNITADTIFIG